MQKSYQIQKIIDSFGHYDMDHRIVAAEDFRNCLASREVVLSSQQIQAAFNGLTHAIVHDHSSEVKRAAGQALAELAIDAAIRNDNSTSTMVATRLLSYLWNREKSTRITPLIETMDADEQQLLSGLNAAAGYILSTLEGELAPAKGRTNIDARHLGVCFIQTLLEPVLEFDKFTNTAALEACLQHSIDLCRLCFPRRQEQVDNGLISTAGVLFGKVVAHYRNDVAGNGVERRLNRILAEMTNLLPVSTLTENLKEILSLYKDVAKDGNRPAAWKLSVQLLTMYAERSADVLLRNPNVEKWELFKSAVQVFASALLHPSLQPDVETLEIMTSNLRQCMPKFEGTAISLEISRSLLDYFFPIMEQGNEYHDESGTMEDTEYVDDGDIDYSEELMDAEYGDFMEEDGSTECAVSWRYKVTLLKIVEPCLSVLTKYTYDGHAYLTKTLKALNNVAIKSTEKMLSTGALKTILTGVSAYIEQRDCKPRFTSEDNAMIAQLLVALSKSVDEKYLALVTSLAKTDFFGSQFDTYRAQVVKELQMTTRSVANGLTALQAWAVMLQDHDAAYMKAVEQFVVLTHTNELINHNVWSSICAAYGRSMKTCGALPSIQIQAKCNPTFIELAFWKTVLLNDAVLEARDVIHSICSGLISWLEKTGTGRGTNDVALMTVAVLAYYRCLQLRDQESIQALIAAAAKGKKKIFDVNVAGLMEDNGIVLASNIPDHDLEPIAELICRDLSGDTEALRRIMDNITLPMSDNLAAWKCILSQLPVDAVKHNDILHQGWQLFHGKTDKQFSPLISRYWAVLLEHTPLEPARSVYTEDVMKALKHSVTVNSTSAIHLVRELIKRREEAEAFVASDATLISVLPDTLAKSVVQTARANVQLIKEVTQKLFESDDLEQIQAGVILADGLIPLENTSNRLVTLEALKYKCVNWSIERDPMFIQKALNVMPFEVHTAEDVPDVAASLRCLNSILNEAPISSISLLLDSIPNFIPKLFALVKSSEQYVKKVELGAGVEHVVDATIESRRLALLSMSHLVPLLGVAGLRRAVSEKTPPILNREDKDAILDTICEAVYYGVGDEDDTMSAHGQSIVLRILENEKDFWKALKNRSNQILTILGVCERYFGKQAVNQEDLVNTKINSRLESISDLRARLEVL
eukprot:Blabericola_migrator_1__4738@NODE_249_length_10888_cov_100_919231_g210_i0_p1_GENE_NODE_249_length_10888_cov_100_919231_g210_i0NODE_249_length_10888_cov_100_919231_g210_i0_p1_ORF_typecomplete_len1153_score270_98TIP120/PF08623_10/0_018UME/PF08064_13/1_1UME/PF08064_13/1_4e03UME/PF08064_13/5_5e03UME/PF08064_13/5_8e03_NODE_249_length_10888_cov_100_919231_g210_i06764134